MDLLLTCREHAHKYYLDLLKSAEKTLHDTLFEQAEKLKNNESQRRFYEARQELKDRGNDMQAVFKEQLEKSFHDFTSGADEETSIEQKIDINNLSLVKRDELEDELAISVIISKSNSRNAEILWKLNKRLAVLRSGKSVSDETNPFGPAAICQAIQAAVGQLNFDSKAKIAIYKQLGKILILSFSKELNALNELLVEKKILPNLRFSITKNNQAASPQTPSLQQENIANNESIDSISHQHELYNAIRNFQLSTASRTQTANDVDLSGVAVGGDGGTENFSAMDYALILTAIQQSKTILSSAAYGKPLPTQSIETQLFKQLAQQSSEDGQNKITRDDADTIDLVGMIFRYMLDDNNLHDSVKSLLSHLHTPYLKLALLDKSFLDNYHHSARVLLNSMAEVGGKWVQDEDDRAVLPKIKSTVENILTIFLDDPEIFDQLLEDFAQFRQTIEKRARMVEQRNTESQQGLEKLELSKNQAADEFDKLLHKAQTPSDIAEHIRKPWTDFLSFNLLRHGTNSSIWKTAINIVDEVINGLTPKAIAEHSNDFQRHQTECELSATKSLAAIGYDPQASKNLLNALKKAHELSLQSTAVSASDNIQKTAQRQPTEGLKETKNHTYAKPSVAQQAQTKPTTSTKPKPALLNAKELQTVEHLKEIAFGTWFEFDHNDGAKRLKLVWYSRISSHYMFVDQAGVKQSVKNQEGIAKGIVAGNIRIVIPSKKSFMERALESVFDSLKLNTRNAT
jgi:hypothetical protein